MPGLILVNEFVDETREDYNSPTTSTFVSRMADCRQTIANLEETLDYDRDGLLKMKKAIKAIYNSGNAHVDNEMYLSRALDRLGAASLNKDQEPDIAAAFMKFSVVTKELSALMKTLMQNINNIVMFPVESLLKGDLRGVKGDLKRPFDKAWKDYETKYAKIEKEKKQQAKEAGLIRTEITSAEVAEEMEKERRLFQLQMCEYLLKVNEIKTKKGIELLQHLVEYYHAQTNYFQDGLKTIEHFGNYVADLSIKLQKIRQKQDEERKQLSELRNVLRSAPGFEKDIPAPGVGTPGTEKTGTGYSLHQLQGDKHAGLTRSGHLFKKSEGKMRRVWQKRKCRVQAEGFLDIFHADESKPPTRVNLLTCQIKNVGDDKRCFDLISYNRTYHFQAEDESDQRAWLSVLVNCKDTALRRAFDDSGGKTNESSSLWELQQAIIRLVQRLPGNQACCDCNSMNDATWLSTHFGIIVCIECSGIHRDLGVHISRIQSLTLDNIGTSQLLLARYMTNQAFNSVMESNLHGPKLTPNSSMEERYDYIRAKYVDHKFVRRLCRDEHDLLSELEHAVNNKSLHHLLQVYAEGVDLTAELPTSELGETALHLSILREMGDSLHLVDFLVQNMAPSGLDKPTSLVQDNLENSLNTPLHLCAIHDKVECMKLLLRSGADPLKKNGANRTPLDIAIDKRHEACEELLRHALQHKKTLFENVNIEWNLSHDEGSTDLSDDDTVVDERNGCITPEKKCRSRPPSFAGGDSPVNHRSRPCESMDLSSSRLAMPPPLPLGRKPHIVQPSTVNISGSLKKRAAPLPPVTSLYGNIGSSHSRTPSDPLQNAPPNISGGYHPGNMHKRSPSTDSTKQLIGAKLVLPPNEIPPTLKPVDRSGSCTPNLSGIKRPLGPPPPTPSRLSHGRSNESLSSISSDVDGMSQLNPVPPPRKLKHERLRLESYAEETASDIGLSLPMASSSQPITPTSAGETRGSRDSLLSNTSSTNLTSYPREERIYCNTADLSPRELGLSTFSSSGSKIRDSISQNILVKSQYFNKKSEEGGGKTQQGSGRSSSCSNSNSFIMKRVRALYDCEADREDELSFKVGDIIIVTNQQTDDDNWIEGALETDPGHTGMFPISFVEKIPD
ncbi:hypothetical protein RUM44_004995 [Polyplax serrata]|uniref:Uncharacterized protein n=1 Tax=Polyplax serrata TaxID=468196 RepID=A0ABR1AWM0_POLSC